MNERSISNFALKARTIMRYFVVFCLLTGSVFFQSTIVESQTIAIDKPVINLISNARKSIVSIEAKIPVNHRMGIFGKALKNKLSATDTNQTTCYLSMGSGVVWDVNGHIITTKTIVENAENITVKCANGHSHHAHFVGADDVTNLAVLRLDQPDSSKLDPICKRQKKLAEGSWLVLMGYGYGGMPTVSPGMAGMPPEDFDTGRHWFQFTAPLRPGNSGGALVDSDGKLAGIVLGREEDLGFNAVVKMLTGKSENQKIPQRNAYSNFGIGVPINKTTTVVEQIIQDGKVVRGWMGISVRQLTDLTTGESDLIVVRVIPDSPAAQAGIHEGDRLTCINGVDINDPVQLGRVVQNLLPGSKLPVDFSRNGEKLRTEITLYERPVNKNCLGKSLNDNKSDLIHDIKVLEGNLDNN